MGHNHRYELKEQCSNEEENRRSVPHRVQYVVGLESLSIKMRRLGEA